VQQIEAVGSSVMTPLYQTTLRYRWQHSDFPLPQYDLTGVPNIPWNSILTQTPVNK